MSAMNIERQLRSFLAEGPTDPPAAVVERALAEARTVPQVRTHEAPWSHLPRVTWPQPQALARFGLASAVLVVAVLIGIWGLSGVPISPAESPTPSSSSRPTPSDSPRPARWEELGRIESEDDNFRLIAFGAGYVAWIDFSSPAWYSADGVDWQPADLPKNEIACQGEVQPDQIEAATSSGDTVVMIGSVLLPGPDTFCWLQSVAWWTTDGLNWERSAPFGQLRALSEARPQAVWSVEGEFEAAVGSHRSPQGDVSETVIWRSADAQQWTALATLDGVGDVVAGASPSGVRVVSVSGTTLSVEGVSYSQTLLASSPDGIEWTTLQSPRRGWVVREILAPSQPSEEWSVLATTGQGSQNALFYSADVADWTEHPSPSDELFALSRTAEGIVATGCADADLSECRQYISSGSGPSARWQEVPPVLGSMRAADGPTGVLAVLGWPPQSDSAGTVFRLVP